jgi:hypothetical protein
MTTLSEKVRADQLAALATLDQDENSPVAKATLSVYDQIDALDSDGRDLLVLTCLGKISSLAHDFDPKDPTADMLMHTVTSVAGYASQRNREDAGITVNGDTRIDAILVTIKDAVSEGLRVLAPDAMRLAEEGAASTKARIAKGEDPAEVYQDELRKIKEGVDAAARAGLDQDEEESEPSTGLYL